MNIIVKNMGFILADGNLIKEFDIPIDEILIFDKGIAVLLDYWFYLKKYRDSKNVFFYRF